MAKTVKPIADIFRLHEHSGLVVERFTESRWFSIVLVLSNSVLSTCAEVLLKIGATHPSAIAFPAPIAFVSAIFSYWVLLGIFAYIGSLKLPRFDGHGNSNERENPDGSEKEAHYL
jgi:hypothetical protein